MNNRLGIITKEKDGFQVAFDRIFPHDIQTVWKAITDPEQLKFWFTDIEMEFKEGGTIKIIFRDADKTVTQGKIISIDPPHKFVWTWEDELAVWELFAEGEKKCRLKFTYSKLSDQHAANVPTGFHVLLDRLEARLNGDTSIYPFGTEENEPAHAELKEIYKKLVFQKFPELEIPSFVIEKIYQAPIELVWKAITEKEQLKQWYFDFSEEFKLEIGRTFDWYAGPPGGKQWHHRGKILEIVAGKKLVHTWEYPGYTGLSTVSWELTSVDKNSTKLVFTHTFNIPFDPKEEALRRENFAEGWNSIIHNGLVDFLKKQVR